MKDIPGWEGLYKISKNGAVFSVRSDRLLALKTHRDGHLVAGLCLAGKVHWKFVHRLVLEAFVGPCPEGMECRHLDDVAHNNRLENLAWGTHKQNHSDRIRLGTQLCGSRHGQAKLTEAAVREIRRLLSQGAAQSKLAAQFSVSKFVIGSIHRRRTWTHV